MCSPLVAVSKKDFGRGLRRAWLMLSKTSPILGDGTGLAQPPLASQVVHREQDGDAEDEPHSYDPRSIGKRRLRQRGHRLVADPDHRYGGQDKEQPMEASRNNFVGQAF